METVFNKKIETIEEVLDFLGSIPCINRGGCGIAAYTIYLYLKKHNQLPKDFAIIYLHDGVWSGDSFKLNSSFLSGTTDNATACSHAVVYMNGQLYDSDGVYYGDMFDYQLSIGKNVIEEFMRSSLQGGNWNYEFPRRLYLPIIEEKLGIEFNID